ncbi:hypothetical protein C2E21_2145 [Chlorella sorokiniana]|uniref:Uncharacterized protein n=1 Tax=Chlorella sorokiniana TaxID=3076 RepID=A0A2P6TXX9_CHLSO|nr:hypothetical protein C2E21_2145 [Chlorella sorokiniana]|eukprot:PRW58927.1 hypothetical protein C2E21_2145 [Chlorella sorokiniana]
MAAPSSNAAIRKALRQFEDGLQTFCGQLATETAELRRNVENQPCTGAYYRNVLEDLQLRADAVGQELQSLGALSLDAVSIEELVGHSVALYCQNYEQIQQLEATLAQYGYRDLYAPLPPENPLDMLELTAGARGQGRQPQHPDVEAEGQEYGEADEAAAGAYGSEQPLVAEGFLEAEEEALGEVTNRLAGARLAAECDASPAGQRAGGGAPPPRTALKAMAPMTAAKALMRPADTPSSLASPEALSPSMRELLGRYAASSGGGLSLHPLSSAPTSGTPRLGSGSAGPRGATPSYLSPAFQLAAMEQEVQMAHASAAAAQQGGGGNGDTPPAAPGWEADDAMYNALTATAKKLADKPSFMEAYRQKFPHIMASTERLLQTVEKQRRPAAAAAVAVEEAAAGPMAALTLAAHAAAGHLGRRHVPDEESTMDLMAQVLVSRRPLTDDHTAELGDMVASAAGSPPLAPADDQEQQERPAPTTAALLSRAMGSGAAAAVAAAGSSEHHPISSLRADDPPSTAAAAAAAGVPQSAPRSERSKPQLEAAIAAALGRSTAAAPTPAAAPPAVPSATPAAAAAAPRPPPAMPASVARAPPPPPAAPAAPAAPSGAPTPAAPVTVPALRLVGEEEYVELPSFIRSQLALQVLNSTLQQLHALAMERSSGFTMADVEAAGLGAKCKVVVNSLVKLGRAQLKVAAQGTLYLLT